MPDRLWGQLLLQLVLILVNAFFAATEIAVISLNDKKVKKLSESGDKKAGRLMKMVENPDRFLSTIQIGITLAGFLGSAFAADNFASRIRDWLVIDLKVTAISPDTINSIAIVLITIILSYFTLVLGELVPKRIAMKKPEKVAQFASGVIAFVAAVMRPVIWLLSVSTNGMLYLLHLDPHDEDEKVTEEEIRLMVDAGEEGGAIETNEKEMIENIFEFNNITAADVMTHRTEMTALWVDETDDFIVNTIIETGYSRFPVYDEDIDNIIGILSARQFFLNKYKAQPLSLRELLYSAYFVPETVRADMLLRDMQKKKVHMAIVLDEYGGTSGVVTMEDLLEEIVGNIYDESDKQTQQDIIKLADNLWRVNGAVELERLEDELNVNFDDEDDECYTLGGLIFSQFTMIPEDGSTPELDIKFLHVKVESIVDHRVEWALLSVNPPEDQDADAESADGERPKERGHEFGRIKDKERESEKPGERASFRDREKDRKKSGDADD